jgi:hypothetical protein
MKKKVIGELKLTTVKIFEDKYHKFKEVNVDGDMTLQRLVNRALLLYLNDPEFKKKIDGTVELQVSGSSF